MFASTNLSRRHLIGTGAAALALAPPLLAQTANPPAGEAPTQIPTGSDRAKLLTIDVAINGQGPFKFVVDTGADRSVMADTAALKLGLAHASKVKVEGVVRTVPAETVKVDSLSFGNFTKNDLVMPILPYGWLDADGYLGLDVIDRYRVTLDFKEQHLAIERSRSFWLLDTNRMGTARVNAVGSQGKLRSVHCRIDGVPAYAFLDTGAEISVGNAALFNVLNERHPDRYVKTKTVTLSGVTGGELQGRLVEFGKISLQSLDFTDGSVVISDLQIFKLWDLMDHPALLIGMNFLRQFDRVSIDYGRKEFDFQIAQLNVAGSGDSRRG